MATVISDEQASQNIAANLQQIMAERGISQTELAAMTNKPLMSINRLVRGQNEPRIAIVACVAEALRTSVDMLLAPPPSPLVTVGMATPQENFSASS